MKENLNDISDYYTERIKTFGASSKGVDWNGGASHLMRFEQLTKLISQPEKGECVLDFGCGYGAYLDYLKQLDYPLEYVGVDISSAMIEAARAAHPAEKNQYYHAESLERVSFDYIIANGVFNVKLNQTESSWVAYVEESLDDLNERSTKGFAFNILTSYSDTDKRQSHLYYADPLYWFDWCKRHCSRNVALLHDYDLYEFTILVKKVVR